VSIASWLLVGLAATQGQAVELRLTDAEPIESAHARWGDRSIPFVRDGAGWTTVIGVDLDTPPGAHIVPITLDLTGGGTEIIEERIEVAPGTYRTTELTVEQRYVELNPEDQDRAAREGREIAAIYATLTPERYWTTAFEVPIPGTSGGRNFGHRRVFNGQPRAPHSGADLRAPTGTPILAANRGRVVLAKDLFFSGNAVFLDHGLGLYSVYLHLSEIDVGVGTMVEQGERIGLAGATGRVTGPHLHWGVRILDARVDPFTLLELNKQ
jgi:murein DD-endopeptidase MepM/ murein hydrolase activator NlpD